MTCLSPSFWCCQEPLVFSACRHITPISVSVITQCPLLECVTVSFLLFLWGPVMVDRRSPTAAVRPHLNLDPNSTCKDPISKWICSHSDQRLGPQCIFWWGALRGTKSNPQNAVIRRFETEQWPFLKKLLLLAWKLHTGDKTGGMQSSQDQREGVVTTQTATKTA